VKGTEAIQAGNLEVRLPVKSRDEIGLLTRSFNAMGVELELKERYRSVLDKVPDPQVADELMRGSLDLGGEERETTVLFCDIRGFTPLTEGMRPAEVIAMLNEHMTALTEVVYTHHGVVDKFVGDEIMVMFGSPRSYGDDAVNGARCALGMLRKREELNETGRYRIRIGVGVASGEVVAGCMGSVDRLNYTVLGEKVNLASRLCSVAGGMEVLVDGATRERLGDGAVVERCDNLSLKGFAGVVEAYRLEACG
jgi:class 3 adenylate cyclase